MTFEYSEKAKEAFKLNRDINMKLADIDTESGKLRCALRFIEKISNTETFSTANHYSLQKEAKILLRDLTE